MNTIFKTFCLFLVLAASSDFVVGAESTSKTQAQIEDSNRIKPLDIMSPETEKLFIADNQKVLGLIKSSGQDQPEVTNLQAKIHAVEQILQKLSSANESQKNSWKEQAKQFLDQHYASANIVQNIESFISGLQ